MRERTALRAAGVEAAGTAAAAALALLGAVLALRLWHVDWNVPMLPGGDEYLAESTVRTMQIDGSWLFTNLLGAPLGQDLRAWPSSTGDLWNLLALRLGSLVATPSATINLLYVLGFPVIAGSAYLALRWLRTSWWTAVALGAVYSWLPYHFIRGEGHLFLGNYASIPVACVLALAVLNGRLRLGRGRWPWAGALAGAVILGGTGIYYGAFAVVAIGCAGLLASIARRGWRPLVSAATLCAVTVLTIIATSWPTVSYSLAHSSSDVAGRSFGSSELNGLKISNLILPHPTHRLALLGAIRGAADPSSAIPGEGTETLGLLGVVGLVTIVIALLLPVVGRRLSLASDLHELGLMAIICILWATVSGLNAVLAALGFDQLRAWNRISVMIAFFALAGTARLVDAGLARLHLPPRRAGLVAAPVAAVIAVIGLLDQSSDKLVPSYDASAANWSADQTYFATVEKELGSGAAVLQLPYIPFPEYPQVLGIPPYDHLRGYLHSDIRWSYGAVQDEDTDWQPAALADGIAAALPSAVGAGFSAVYIDRRGYADGGAAVEAELTSVIGDQTPLVNADGSLAVYDLRPYAAALRAAGTTIPNLDDVVHPPRVTLGQGTYPEETHATGSWTWAEATATATVTNPVSYSRQARLTATVAVATPDATVTVTVGTSQTQFRAVNGTVHIDILQEFAPGTTSVVLTTDSAATPGGGGDARTLYQRLSDVRVELVP